MPAELCKPLSWSVPPEAVLDRWRPDRALLTLCSGGSSAQSSSPWSRWTYFTSPVSVDTSGHGSGGLLAQFEGPRDQAGRQAGRETAACEPPFTGGWVAALGYELGRGLEPAASIQAERRDPAWPWPVVLWRAPSVLAYDAWERRWWWCGQGSPDHWLLAAPAPDAEATVGPFRSEWGAEGYIQAARRAVEYIHAGDCFQVNLAHRLGATFEGSARAAFARLARAALPWYGAYLELEREGHVHAALSVSPELLVSLDAETGLLTTRPIKGTRRADADSRELRESEKDRAELTMIIDLMRNDLGRVCRIGSVRVAEARTIERHGGAGGSGVHHGVATVQGTLAQGRSIADLVRAVFPGGSITGAPKIRSMQIIEELEPSARGLYTGAIGYVGDNGNVMLNIAIRTAVVHGRRAAGPALDRIREGRIVYSVGAGIVAESVPKLEWQETLDKAGVLRAFATPDLEPDGCVSAAVEPVREVHV